jgi:hypothetical protein
MAKDIEVDININSNTEATIKNLKALKRQLRETAAGSDEFNRISQQIRDMDDAIKDASATSDDFLGYLENASGPLGVLGKGIRGAEKTFSSFNGVLKASVIGIITLAIGGLVAAFSKSESAMKKLEPVFAAFDKILQGIMKVFEPLLDAFIDLALRALPLIAKGVGGFYSGLFALFTLVKNVGMGAGKILKGIFTLDFDSLKSGYEQLTGSWNSAVEEFKEANKRFNSGSDTVTKTEKKNSAERVKTHKKEVKEKTKENEIYIDEYTKSLVDEFLAFEAHQKKIVELEKQYATELEDLEANTEQKKLDLWYKRRKAEIDAIAETEKEKNSLYALLNEQRDLKQLEIESKTEDSLTKIRREGEEARTKDDEIQAERRKKIAEQEVLAKRELLNLYSNALSVASGLLGESTVAGKAAAVASATISTYLAATQAYASQLTPGDPTSPFRATLAAGIAVAAGLANVRKILAVQTPGGGGSGGAAPSASTPQAPSFNVVGTGGANQIAQTIGAQSQTPVRAYVVSSDVTTQQALDRNIVKSATLG